MIKFHHILSAGTLKKGVIANNILKAGIFRAPFFRPEFLEKADKVLIVFLSLLIIYLLADFVIFNPSVSVKKSIVSLSEKAASARHAAGASKAAKDYSYYGSVLSEKQVFGGSFADRVESVPESPREIELVGIIPGNRLQAIIENKKTQDLYYVHEGDKFENFIVEKVDSDKAVLYTEGERIELPL